MATWRRSGRSAARRKARGRSISAEPRLLPTIARGSRYSYPTERTIHDFSYDPIHDEIVITSALAQAILTFRGAANGEEPPIRIIQGNKTGILAVGALDKVTIDPVHEEYFITTPNQEVLVFSRLAQGNAAPIRVLKGPDTQLQVG